MLRTGNQIRLNQAEKDRLTTLTGANTDDVKSIEALNNFVDFHKGMYAGDTPEEKLLKHLLEQEKIISMSRHNGSLTFSESKKC